MDERAKKRRIRNILLVAGTLVVIAVIVLIVWLVNKYDVVNSHNMGEPVGYDGAEITVDGVQFVREYDGESAKDGAIYAVVYITLEGKANLLELQVAGVDRVAALDGTFGGNTYTAAPEGDAQSGRYTLVFLAVERADTYLFIGEKDRVFLGTSLVIETRTEAK